MHDVPIEPPAGLEPFRPVARRVVRVFDADLTLVLVPGRAGRSGRAGPERAAFQRCIAERIVRAEASWRGGGLALTPNRYPFAAEQRILWADTPLREPDEAFWRAIGSWVERSGGAALVNQIGAAATIARAHAHLIPEREPFLDAVPDDPCPVDLIDLPDGVELRQKRLPFCVLGVRGPASARATALHRLAETRMTSACSFVVQRDCAWLMPRRCETPAPWFPQPLGAAELWGRFCYLEAAPFAAASADDLLHAFTTAGTPPLG